jgi:hypothetical protein
MVFKIALVLNELTAVSERVFKIRSVPDKREKFGAFCKEIPL